MMIIVIVHMYIALFTEGHTVEYLISYLCYPLKPMNKKCLIHKMICSLQI